MKTRNINTTNQRTNRIRMSMILAGIVTAIICSLALLSEEQPTESYGSVNRLIETSKIIDTEFSIQVVGKAMVSVLWPL